MKRVFLDESVGIDEKQELPPSSLEAEVVGLRKTKIDLACDKVNCREATTHHFDTAVVRRIVDDDDLSANALHRLLQ